MSFKKSLIVLNFIFFSLSGCTKDEPKKEEVKPEAAQQQPAAQTGAPAQEAQVQNVTELKITDVKVGDGAEAVQGKKIKVHYTGTLLNGTKFDSSKDRGQPFEFNLGAGQVIKGWDEGFKGMKVGGVRQLLIPANMAYGERGVGPIPPNSPLKFDVELLGVQ